MGQVRTLTVLTVNRPAESGNTFTDVSISGASLITVSAETTCLTLDPMSPQISSKRYKSEHDRKQFLSGTLLVPSQFQTRSQY